MRYVLAPGAAARRARVLAASGAAIAVAPAWLLVVLVAELRVASQWVVVGVAAAIGALGIARGIVSYRASLRRLASLAIDLDDEGLDVRSERGETRVPRGAIARVAEIDGSYGGLRLQLRGSMPGVGQAAPRAAVPSPSRIEIPRGGDAFADLRAALSSWLPIERAPRRGRAARIALGVTVVLALFFVPFVIADARGSRAAVATLLLVAWGIMRAVVART